jgi:hypothetical protein
MSTNRTMTACTRAQDCDSIAIKMHNGLQHSDLASIRAKGSLYQADSSPQFKVGTWR